MANKASDYINGFRLYDQYVDLVSVFESMFTRAEDYARTVVHFERYPTVKAPDGNPARPDFTIVFADGTGLAGEIASVAPQPQALDNTCRQLSRYDSLTELPVNSSGKYQPVSHVDVLLLTDHEHDKTVARRILDCIADEDHWYIPSEPPLIASWTFSGNESPSRYVISKIPLPSNGALREDGRDPAIGRWLEERNLLSSADLFGPTKVERVFMNDPIDPLYLATHLWTRLFAELSPTHSNNPNPLYLTRSEIADELQDRYGRGSRSDVDKAMNHLKQARLCDLEPDGQTWLIAWHELRGATGEREAASRIAHRIAKPPAKGAIRRVREEIANNDELRLF